MSGPERVISQVALLANESLRGEVRDHLERGGLIAYPTATVYGFGGHIAESALRSLDALKRRPPEKPFLLLVNRRDQTAELAWTDEARALAGHFWPGPLTLVLSDPTDRFPARVRGPEGGVAVRHSGHLGTRIVLGASGAPITSSSANERGQPPAQSGLEAVEVTRQLEGRDVWVVDGGRLPVSPSSTLVDCSGGMPRILREGAIPKPEIEAVLGGGEPAVVGRWSRPIRILFVCTGNTCRSPMAEVVAREWLRRLGRSGVEVSSAGVYAADGHPASPEGVEVVGHRGLDLSGHRSRLLTTELLLASDLILTMGGGHLEALVGSDGAARSSTLGAFADGRIDPFDGPSVPDPIGMGLDTYEATFADLASLIERSFARLAPFLGEP